MSKYTTEVRFICESLANLDESKGYNNVDTIIDAARPQIFNFNYPIFDNSYKPLLEKKILKHFYTREICEETYGLWHLRLDAKMNEIMPYYNKLYESELLEFNPLDDVNKHIQHTGNDSGESTDTGTSRSNTVRDGTSGSDIADTGTSRLNTVRDGTSSRDISDSDSTSENTVRDGTSGSVTDNEKWDLFSDTPQGGISGIENAYDGVDDNAYLTDARNIKDHGTVDNEFEDESTTTGTKTHTSNIDDEFEDETTATGNTTNSRNIDNEFEDESTTTGNVTNNRTFENENAWSEIITGKQGTKTYSSMLLEFRETFMNIDAMILEELNGLFFQLY